MKTRYVLAALAAILLATGCFQDVHEIDPSKNVGYVVPELQWADPALAGTEIHDLLVIVNGEREAFTKHYTNVRDIARDPLEVPAGECSIMVLANASEADGYRLSGLPATKFTLMEILLYYPVLNALAYNNCYMGSTAVQVDNNAFRSSPTPMKPVMPSVSMSMSNIPEGASVNVAMSNAAASISMVPSEGGTFAPSLQPCNGDIELGDLATGNIKTIVPPTVGGSLTCDMSLSVTLPDGSSSGKSQRGRESLKIRMTAPRIDCGGDYSIALDFKNLVTVLEFGTFIIEDWDEEHSYDGRVYE